MIFDRTELDVSLAREIIEEKVKTFSSLTDEDLSILERGTITSDTINRIFEKENQIAEIAKVLGYYGANIDFFQDVTLNDGDAFYKYQLEGMFENATKIRSGAPCNHDTPKYIYPLYVWTEMNKIEKILYDAGENLEYIFQNSPECNTFTCGELI